MTQTSIGLFTVNRAVAVFTPGIERRIDMTTQKRSTVIGVFEDRLDADRAVGQLLAADFRQDQIGVAMRHTDDVTMGRETTDANNAPTQAESGAIAGALTGLGLGTLAGLGVVAGVVPVIGPAIAAGTLGVIASNAVVGAGIAGLAGALIGAGIPEDEAEYYDGELIAGKTVVTVMADGRYEEALAIIRRNDGSQMNASKAEVVGVV
jgi:hypothetical protein